jgi:hypothetical protein
MNAQAEFELRPPGAEEAERDRVLENLAEARSAWLEDIRAEMWRLYLERDREQFLEWSRGIEPASPPYVTADDARAYFESLGPPPPEALSRNFLGSVFRGRAWERVGYTTSRTPGSHANLIAKWQFVGAR